MYTRCAWPGDPAHMVCTINTSSRSAPLIRSARGLGDRGISPVSGLPASWAPWWPFSLPAWLPFPSSVLHAFSVPALPSSVLGSGSKGSVPCSHTCPARVPASPSWEILTALSLHAFPAVFTPGVWVWPGLKGKCRLQWGPAPSSSHPKYPMLSMGQYLGTRTNRQGSKGVTLVTGLCTTPVILAGWPGAFWGWLYRAGLLPALVPGALSFPAVPV